MALWLFRRIPLPLIVLSGSKAAQEVFAEASKHERNGYFFGRATRWKQSEIIGFIETARAPHGERAICAPGAPGA